MKKVTLFPRRKTKERLESYAIHGNSFNARLNNLRSRGVPEMYLQIFDGYKDMSKEKKGLAVLQLERFEKYNPSAAIRRAATLRSNYDYAQEHKAAVEANRILRKWNKNERVELPKKERPFQNRKNVPDTRALARINQRPNNLQEFKRQYISGFETVIGDNPNAKEKAVLRKLKRMSASKIYAIQNSGNDMLDIAMWYDSYMSTGDYSWIDDILNFIGDIK